MSRIPDKTSPPEVDFTKVINTDKFFSSSPCFGSEWDSTSKECQVCSMNDLCGVVFSKNLVKKVKKLEEEQEVPFLDQADFQKVDVKKLLSDIEKRSGEISLQEVFDRVAAESHCGDDLSVKAWLKEFIKSNPVKTVQGKFVWSKD